MKRYLALVVLLFSCPVLWAHTSGALTIYKNKIVLPSRVELKPDSKGYYIVSDTITDIVNKIQLGDDVVKKNKNTGEKEKQKFSIEGYGYDKVFSTTIRASMNESEGIKKLEFAKFQDSLLIKVDTLKWLLKPMQKRILKKRDGFSLTDTDFLYDSNGSFYYFDTIKKKKEFTFTHFEIFDSIRLFLNNKEIRLQKIGNLYMLPSEMKVSSKDSVEILVGCDTLKIYPYPIYNKTPPIPPTITITKNRYWLMFAGDVLAVLFVFVWLSWNLIKLVKKKEQEHTLLINESKDLRNRADSIINQLRAEKDDELIRLRDELAECLKKKEVVNTKKVTEELKKYLNECQSQQEKTSLINESKDLLNRADSVIQKKRQEQSDEKEDNNKLKDLKEKLEKYIEDIDNNKEETQAIKNELEKCLEQEEARETINEQIDLERDKAEKETVERIAVLLEQATSGTFKKESIIKELNGKSLSFIERYILKEIEDCTKGCPLTVGKIWSDVSKENIGKSAHQKMDGFVRMLNDKILEPPQQVQIPVWDENLSFSEIFDKLSLKQKNGFYTKVLQLLKEKKLKGKDDTLDNFIISLLETQTKAESIRPKEYVVRDCVKNNNIPEDVKDELAKRFVAVLNERIKDEPLRLSADIITLESLIVELLEKHIEVPHLNEEVDEKVNIIVKEKENQINTRLQGEMNKKLQSQLNQKADEYAKAIRSTKKEYENNLKIARKFYQNNEEKNRKALADKEKELLNLANQFKTDKQTLENQYNIKLEEEKTKQQKEFDNKIASINDELTTEKQQHLIDLSKLKDYCLATIADINSVMISVTTSINKAASGSSSDGLKSLVFDSILDNDELGMESFFTQLNEVISNSEVKSIGEFKEEVKTILMQSFSTYRPTWIDVLTRLFLYSKEHFIAYQFVENELDLCEVGAAFYMAENLFKSFGIDLVYPKLFDESFDAEKYEDRSLRDIDSYVEGLVTHINKADAIVDLYMVGYQINGKLEKKPIVSRFS